MPYKFDFECMYSDPNLKEQPKRGPEVYTEPSQINVGDVVVIKKRNCLPHTVKVIKVGAFYLCTEVNGKEQIKSYLTDLCLEPYLHDNSWNPTNYVRKATPEEKSQFEKN